jgi:hypothetical protein
MRDVFSSTVCHLRTAVQCRESGQADIGQLCVLYQTTPSAPQQLSPFRYKQQYWHTDTNLAPKDMQTHTFWNYSALP